MGVLIRAGALDSLGERRQLLWDLAETMDIARRPPMLPLTIPSERLVMPPMTEDEKTLVTFNATGVSGDRHILDLKRDAFDEAGYLRLPKLQRQSVGVKVRIGGIMVDGLRTPPTAKGAGFCRLEQAEGIVDMTFPAALLQDKASRKGLRHAFIVVEGILKLTGKVVSVTATAVYPLQDFRDTNDHRNREQSVVGQGIFNGRESAKLPVRMCESKRNRHTINRGVARTVHSTYLGLGMRAPTPTWGRTSLFLSRTLSGKGHPAAWTTQFS